MKLADLFVYLWLLPVILQIVIPLGILGVVLGKRLVDSVVGKNAVVINQKSDAAVGVTKA